MASQFEEVAELIGRIQVLKNQLEEAAAVIKKDSEENYARLNNEFKQFENKVDSFLDKAKGLTRITNSHYWSVAGGAFCLGVALSIIGCFSFSNWINQDLIEQRAEIKIEQEQLTKEQQQTQAVKAKYERFEVFNELVSLLAEFREIDPDAVQIFSGKNYLEKTLKDDTEEVLVLNIKPEYITACTDGTSQKCYRNPDKKDYASFNGFFQASNGSFVISFKKKPTK